MKKIELLAPAKDLECGIAAIKCGADAVYIGAEKFGARSSAGNDSESIKKLCDYAHFYGVKIYVTVNTIMNNKELIESEKLINKLYSIGVDAIIVQDMGILELDLPLIPLFASTQTHNTSLEKVQFLEKVGFKRVILGRELGIDQIEEIKSKTSIELESFIHGSLCVSYSGQCYLSQAIGGRSGNRGECAQPCRKKYSLKTKSDEFIVQDKHLLSLKDLNLSGYISQLLGAGITSLKIEGRLKDVNYIKNIVSFYNNKLNKILESGSGFERSSKGNITADFIPNPSKTFNRGYSTYFINGREKDIVSVNTPKSLGESIGVITDIKNDCINIKITSIEKKLNNGDGICFFDKNNDLLGTTINSVDGDSIYPNDMKNIKKGYFVYRNHDHEFNKTVKSANIERKIPVKIEVYEDKEDLVIKITDIDANQVQKVIKNDFDIANNQEMAITNIKKQLSKLGETNFACDEFIINIEKAKFIPMKQLNELRRTLIEELAYNRIKSYTQEEFSIEKNDFPYPEKELTYKANVLNTKAENFYKRHGVESIELAAESGIRMIGKAIMTTKYCLKYQYDMCPKSKVKSHDFDKDEKLFLVDDKQKSYLLDFDCKNCEMKILLKVSDK